MSPATSTGLRSFTRVATFPPDFGVTEQLSEFKEEESSSSSSSSATSSSSSTSSSHSELMCDCCDLLPILLTSNGWTDVPGVPGFNPPHASCEEMQESYGGMFLLPFQGQIVGVIDETCDDVDVHTYCLWSERFGAAPFISWTASIIYLPGGGKIAVVTLNIEDPTTFNGIAQLGRWIKPIADDCTNIDETFDFGDYCPCFDFRAIAACFCDNPFFVEQVWQTVLENVTIRLQCQTEPEEEESMSSRSSASSSSSSSKSASSQSKSSQSKSSRSSRSSQSSSSLSEASSESSSSSRSASSQSTSSSGLACPCCDPQIPIAETAYVRIFNLVQNDQCFEPCENVISKIGNEPCYALTRIDQCTWEGQADQDATCFPLSTMRLMLGCDANSVTFTLYWFLSATDVAIYEHTIAASTIACSGCLTHELNPIDNAVACATQFSWAQVNFGQFGACCNYCPDHYQVTIENVFENDVSERCEDADCQQLNGEYLLPFVQRGVSPTGACTDGLEDWCEYSTPLALRCQDARYGFCSLHLFVKTTSNCGTKIRFEIRVDVHDTDDCDAINVRQGWQLDMDGTVHPVTNCFDINAVMDLNDVCLDANWNCTADPIVIRVQAPDVAEPRTLTRLTPLGISGYKFF